MCCGFCSAHAVGRLCGHGARGSLAVLLQSCCVIITATVLATLLCYCGSRAAILTAMLLARGHLVALASCCSSRAYWSCWPACRMLTASYAGAPMCKLPASCFTCLHVLLSRHMMFAIICAIMSVCRSAQGSMLSW